MSLRELLNDVYSGKIGEDEIEGYECVKTKDGIKYRKEGTKRFTTVKLKTDIDNPKVTVVKSEDVKLVPTVVDHKEEHSTIPIVDGGKEKKPKKEKPVKDVEYYKSKFVIKEEAKYLAKQEVKSKRKEKELNEKVTVKPQPQQSQKEETPGISSSEQQEENRNTSAPPVVNEENRLYNSFLEHMSGYMM